MEPSSSSLTKIERMDVVVKIVDSIRTLEELAGNEISYTAVRDRVTEWERKQFEAAGGNREVYMKAIDKKRLQYHEALNAAKTKMVPPPPPPSVTAPTPKKKRTYTKRTVTTKVREVVLEGDGEEGVTQPIVLPVKKRKAVLAPPSLPNTTVTPIFLVPVTPITLQMLFLKLEHLRCKLRAITMFYHDKQLIRQRLEFMNIYKVLTEMNKLVSSFGQEEFMALMQRMLILEQNLNPCFAQIRQRINCQTDEQVFELLKIEFGILQRYVETNGGGEITKRCQNAADVLDGAHVLKRMKESSSS